MLDVFLTIVGQASKHNVVFINSCFISTSSTVTTKPNFAQQTGMLR